MWCVYVIQHTETRQHYIGSTSDLTKRVDQHNQGMTKATQRKDGRWILIYAEAYRSKQDAQRREQMLKHHGNAKQKLFLRIRNSFLEVQK